MHRVVDQWPLALVLVILVGGLLTVAVGAFRAGSVMVAAACLFAAFLRALLPRDVVGMLAIRSRGIDVAIMSVLGVALAAVAFSVPGP